MNMTEEKKALFDKATRNDVAECPYCLDRRPEGCGICKPAPTYVTNDDHVAAHVPGVGSIVLTPAAAEALDAAPNRHFEVIKRDWHLYPWSPCVDSGAPLEVEGVLLNLAGREDEGFKRDVYTVA